MALNEEHQETAADSIGQLRPCCYVQAGSGCAMVTLKASTQCRGMHASPSGTGLRSTPACCPSRSWRWRRAARSRSSPPTPAAA